MNREKPTDAQVKELWDWCGFERLPQGNRDYHYEATVKIMDWRKPNGATMPFLPSLDLNNLFEYAVSLAIKKIMAEQECDKELAYAILFKKWLQKGFDADALFWVIWEVIHD